MATVTFDALKYIKTLEDAGVPRKQAEAQATAEKEALNEVFEAIKAGIPSKEEVTTFKSELSGDLKALRSDLKAEIAVAKLDTVKWIVGSVFASTIAIITTIIKLLH